MSILDERHTIDVTELNAWIGQHWTRYAASHDAKGRSAKTLDIRCDGRLRVTDHSKIVYEGDSKRKAIAHYNNLI